MEGEESEAMIVRWSGRQTEYRARGQDERRVVEERWWFVEVRCELRGGECRSRSDLVRIVKRKAN